MRDIFLVKADPRVSIVCFRVRAAGVEYAFDRVRGAGDVGAAFDRCERGRDQHHQKGDDADDGEQFYESKSPRALKAFAGDAAVLRRGKPPGF